VSTLTQANFWYPVEVLLIVKTVFDLSGAWLMVLIIGMVKIALIDSAQDQSAATDLSAAPSTQHRSATLSPLTVILIDLL